MASPLNSSAGISILLTFAKASSGPAISISSGASFTLEMEYPSFTSISDVSASTGTVVVRYSVTDTLTPTLPRLFASLDWSITLLFSSYNTSAESSTVFSESPDTLTSASTLLIFSTRDFGPLIVTVSGSAVSLPST